MLFEDEESKTESAMLIMSKSIATLTTYPTYHSHRNKSNYAKSPNCFILFRQSWSTFLLPSNMDLSCGSSVGVSATLSETTHNNVTVDKNAKICKFCEMGDLRNAMKLLSRSQRSELELNTYCSVLQLCAELKSLEDGKRVHSIISSNGMAIDEVFGAKLVFMYVNCGDLVKGRRIFDGILNDKIFLWNLLMSEYAKIGNYRESVGLFEKMQELGIRGDSYTFTCVLKCFAASAKVRECKRVHGYVLKLGFGSYNAVVNSLIAAYFKCGEVESARILFDELSDRDVVSWNSMISGCTMNGFSRNGLEFFIQMLNLGVDVDSATLVNVLVACANVGNLTLGRALHAYGVKAGFSGGVMFNNTLLDMYSKCGNLNGANEVFVKMGETTIVSWTSIIAAHVREGLHYEAIGLFDEMQSKGLRPDIYAVTSVVHACACSNSLDKGREVHNHIKKNNMGSNLPVSNALMNMYAKCGSMEEANLIFSQLPVKNIVSWNTMIGGYSQNSLPNEALQLFLDMQKQLKPDDVTMACVLPACAGLAALEKGREIHGHILRKGYFSDLHVACALVDMYVKCGLLVLAQQLFDMIPKKDMILWTVMIAGYGMHGFGKEAISTFEKMRVAGIEPEESSFTSILYACTHSGLLKEGWKLFDSMKSECNIEPKLEHYACMVDLLIRSGNLSRAYKFIETMPIKPDAAIWGALLSGCRIHHDVELAEKVAEHIFELEPENTRYYVLLANVYAEAEKWEEVKKIQRRISKGGLKNDQGCSWIEVQGKFNIFFAGDTSHPQAKMIDSLLRKLTMKMNRGGYSNKIKYALINADDRLKEVLLCAHSEKLAMAFGILNLPPGRTVRVTKNLRVCGDCHEMGKFMSKTTGREIVLRDSNRFHHFKDGLCSCRGFW
ncbi:pentatricopeptide repeat-containing protein DOT4, chloroplastic-like [Glycine soja]|uniref:Pentatricopeptide repeat-containing protein DOT4, chloroplastic n=1 Tax=Glycine soja TaxID=3848 RepID=A0A445JDC7_GLYSO|nr:pentatricopeptide repeat-containing protein DOT4, chloroplastic-like [Glycine soja]RZB96449.1 Pentatricopeptide repeat-containing protein DOT4, chloroplastic [Glycine soja]